MSSRDQKMRKCQRDTFSFWRFNPDIADLFILCMDLNLNAMKSAQKRKSTLIDRIEWLKYGDLNKKWAPYLHNNYANWKNIRVFFWKIGTFFQDTNDKSCLIVSNLGVQNEGTTHREGESNELNRKFYKLSLKMKRICSMGQFVKTQRQHHILRGNVKNICSRLRW